MPLQQLTPEEEFILDAAFGRVEAARRAVDQARRELGTVMRSVGLSASARHLRRSRQWALQVAQESEEPRPTPEGGALPPSDELADSIRRLGIVEPISVVVLSDEVLRVVDGHRRLRVARDAGISSLPVSLLLMADEPPAPASTEQGTRSEIEPEVLEALEETFLRVFDEVRRQAQPTP